MTQPTQPQPMFNPNEVPIQYTLNFSQVNLILKGWGKLPREETEGLYENVRGHAIQTLQNAEAAFKEQMDKAAAEAEAAAAKKAEADKQTGVVDAIAKNLGVDKPEVPNQ